MGLEQGPDTVEKVKAFMVCWVALLESAMDCFMGVDPPPPQDNMCHHISGIERLAY
jgi:hypothetical protein